MPKLVQKADLVALEGLPIAQPQSSWITLNFQKEISVPDDAWVDWDATKQVFITAAEKAKADPKWLKTAKTKVTVVYTPDLWKTTWHDGSSFSLADFVFSMILSFDPGKKESKIYDESLAATIDTLLTHFKGVKIVSTDPLTIETYDDAFALDAENNVKDWYPNLYGPSAFAGGMLAWHNLAPAVQAEADGKMAFGKDKSTNNKVDYTSQASGPTLDVQMQYVDTDIADKYIPYAPTMSTYLKPEDAVTRYNNLKAFYAAHKHIVLGTGPYRVDQIFPVEQSISVVRYDKYIFPADQFSGFGEPELMTLSVDGPTTLAAGTETTFDVTINFKDQPYPAKDIDKVSYTLFNVNGDIVASGAADFVAEGHYKVILSKDLTAKLDAGTAKLAVAAASKAVSLPAFETAQLVVTK
jgi:peptide/nickel transport system substrate-binding protein